MLSSIILAFLLLHPCATAVWGQELLIAAASDLASAERTLTREFAAEHGIQARFVFHSSGMLARQIQNGAPYDVYLSANELYVRQLVDAGELIEDSVAVYATGRLGLWSVSGEIRSLPELMRSGVRHVAIANPAHAPYGLAAKQALESQELWAPLQSRIILAENVRQTFQYGSSGNADAIITSWTLVFDKGGRMLPAEWHEPIRQAGGVLRRSKAHPQSRLFLRFLHGPRGQAALRKHGLFSANN